VVRLKADQLHDLADPVAALARGAELMDAQSIGDAGADLCARIERRERVLEDDLHPPSEWLELASRERRDVGAIEHDPAAGRLDQAQQRVRHYSYPVLALGAFAVTCYGLSARVLPTLVDLVEGGDFEAQSTWYLGLSGEACVRVLRLTDDGPPRLVIDVEH